MVLAVRWALLLAVLLPWLAVAAPSTATPDPVPMTGKWVALSAAGLPDAPAMHSFDPARLRSFGRPPGGTLVLLYPRAGAWPEGPLVLSMASPGFQRISLQLPGEPPRSARLLDPGERRWPGHGRLVFDLQTPPPGGAPLRLHIDARDATPSSIAFEVRSVPDHLRADARWLAFATACLTTMVATALIALFFGLRLRDAAFLWYAGYVLSYAAIQGVQTGYIAHPLGWETVAATAPAWGRAVTTLSVIAAVQFLDRFAPLQAHLPAMRRWLRLYCGLMLVLVVVGYVPALQTTARQLINPMLILGGPLLLGTALAAAWRGSRYAALFLLGWLPLLGVTVLGSLQLYGVASDWTWTGDAALAAGAFEAVVLSLGLAERAASVRRQRDRARALADLDPLTGVLNRRAWQDRMQDHVGTDNLRALSVLFVDLDHFKLVNDRLGHEGGDRVLTLVVESLRSVLRERDVLGRYGGEEFLVGLPDTDTTQACAVAERIRATLRTKSALAGAELALTVSIGVATQRAGEPMDALLRRADAAMYTAKRDGRDRVVVG